MPQITKASSLNSKNKSLPTLIVFTLSLFLSASLMFAVQPMIGKMLLPLAGGTPASWIVAMAFFQIALLAGYMMAWIMSLFEVRVHTLILVGLLSIGFWMLPVKIADYAYILDTKGISPLSIFSILVFAIGLPFAALSTVSSTLQRLFTATDHHHAHDPYFLYAASNGGSLLGLLSYPILIEPIFNLTSQTAYWQFLYGGLIVMCLLCLALAHVSKKTKAKETIIKTDEVITNKRRIEWLLLAFFPSSLLMGTTTHVTTDIISVPLLWVIPLGLYLLTHILAFSKKQFIDKEVIYKLHPIVACLSILLLVNIPGMHKLAISWAGASIFIIVFFIIALALHTKLASLRPHNQYLTQFYFFLALGGALGGSFNAFVAPVIFNDIYELPLIALLSCHMTTYFKTDIKKINIKFLLAGLILLFFYTMLQNIHQVSPVMKWNILLFSITFLFVSDTKTALYTIAFFYIIMNIVAPNTILTDRNFFGVARVYDERIQIPDSDKMAIVRYFSRGTTIHGMQNLDEDVNTSPVTSYYGPLREIMDVYNPKHVGLLGLGAGVIRCYQAPKRYFTMYEIDADAVKIAKEHFDYLKKCGSPKDKIILGDGRLEMQKRSDDKYDLIIMDAFTSDSVPTHLLTKEAFELYKKRLSKNGLIAINISNRYLDLKQVVAATAKTVDLQNVYRFQLEDNKFLELSSEWILIAPKNIDFSSLKNEDWAPVAQKNAAKNVWTDEYTNILSILRL